jgi:phosphatidylglycerol:prolipoprotein diacylglycerol transferase
MLTPPFIATWVHDLSPFFIRFPDNPLGLEGIRYYGIAYLMAFICAYAFFRLADRYGNRGFSADAALSLLTYLVIGVLLGGRIGYYVFYDAASLMQNPLRLLRIWEGGMASHGGFIGVAIALWLFARNQNLSVLTVSDRVTVIAPLGLMLGRIANFINGELWGSITSVRWGVIFPHAPALWDPSIGALVNPARHPSQLYQAALEGGMLLLYLQLRFWLGRPSKGKLAAEFLIGYALLRIIGELFREPDAPLIAGISRGQFYSIWVLLAGIILWRVVHKRTAD